MPKMESFANPNIFTSPGARSDMCGVFWPSGVELCDCIQGEGEVYS